MKLAISAVIALLVAAIEGSAVAAESRRSYVSGKFALLVDGDFAGYVSKVAGGFAQGNVVEETPGPGDWYVQKHVDTPPGYEDITFTVGTGMSQKLYNWIAATLGGDYTRHDGSIVYLDYYGNPLRTLEFDYAQIVEVTFPRLDASSKDVAHMTVTLWPEQSFNQPGGKGRYSGTTESPAKKLLARNFRLAIDGLDMTRTQVVESIDITIPRIPPRVSCLAEGPCPPRAINFPNVEVQLSQENSQSVMQWYEQFVFQGGPEKNGSVQLLSPNLSTVLFKLDLFNLGAISVEEIVPTTSTTESIPRLLLRMYSEYMTLAVAPTSN